VKRKEDPSSINSHQGLRWRTDIIKKKGKERGNRPALLHPAGLSRCRRKGQGDRPANKWRGKKGEGGVNIYIFSVGEKRDRGDHFHSGRKQDVFLSFIIDGRRPKGGERK